MPAPLDLQVQAPLGTRCGCPELEGWGMDELIRLRVRGVLILTMLGWTSTMALLLIALLFDFRNELIPVAFSAAINLIPTYYALRERYDAAAGTAFGVMAAVHPALLLFMLQGHPWQLEAHMFFFVGLATLTLVCEWRPIAVAVAVTAAHQLLFSYFAPEWVFFGSGEFLRVMFHALGLSMVLGVLGPMMVHMGKLFVEQSEARSTSEGLAASAQQALDQAGRRSTRSRPSARSGWRWSAAAWPMRGAAN